MALIPCTTGAQALYRLIPDATNSDETSLGGTYGVPIQAWDDVTGAPYVAGKNGLVTADSFKTNRYTFIRIAGVLTWTGASVKEPQRYVIDDGGV